MPKTGQSAPAATLPKPAATRRTAVAGNLLEDGVDIGQFLFNDASLSSNVLSIG